MSTYSEGRIRLARNSDAYWRVTFDIHPLNIFGPANIPELEEIVGFLESDERVKVVVFDSAVEGFFLTHYNFLAKPEESSQFPLGRTGLQPLPDMLARLSRAPVVSIASIRGRIGDLQLNDSKTSSSRSHLATFMVATAAAVVISPPAPCLRELMVL